MNGKKCNNNSREKIRTYFNKRLFYSSKLKNSAFNTKKNGPKNNTIKVFSIKSKILEKEINNSLQEYSLFKSKIYLKEKKEKESEKNNKYHNESIKELKRNFNYTNMLKLVDIALNKENPFKDYDIKSKINEMEDVNKNIKKNKINGNLTKQILHDTKIRSKVDSGIKKDYNFIKLYQKIKNLKNNLRKRNFFQEKKNIADISKYSEYSTNKEYQNISNKKRIERNSKDFFELTKERRLNKSESLDQTINNKSEIFNNNNNRINIKPKLRRANSVIELNNNSFKIKDNERDSIFSKIKIRKNNSFHFKRVKFNNDNQISKNTSINETLNQISNIKPIEQSHFNKIKKINNSKSKLMKMKYDNKKNEFSNRTISNIKPEKKYKSLIEDIYRDFKRIKLNTIKLKNKYKEWGFSSFKKIDNVLNAKEDMLIFHLKQKYLKHSKIFMKRNKTKNANKSDKSVLNKLKENFDFIDDDDLKIGKKIF